MDQKSGSPNLRRRTVLQGSLAAPVVLTVSSPAAATMTSLGRCLRNAAQEQPSFISASQDTWLRKQIEVFKLEKVKVKDKVAEQGANKGAKTEVTDWVFFDQSLNDYVTVAAPHSRMNIGALTTDWKQAEKSSRWALVWVDERTKSVSMLTQIQPPSGSTCVPTSCWTSITNG
jgi:hypothetical protein